MSYPIGSKTEVKPTDRATSARATKLKSAWLGKVVPNAMLCDNGPAYTSAEYFKLIAAMNVRA